MMFVGGDIYIYIYSKYTAADIEISLSSEILFNWSRLADAKPAMHVENRMARVQDRSTAESTPSSRPNFHSSLHRSRVTDRASECWWIGNEPPMMNVSDWWWSRGIPRFLLNIFWRMMVCGLSIFIYWILRIGKCMIGSKFWILINYKDF